MRDTKHISEQLPVREVARLLKGERERLVKEVRQAARRILGVARRVEVSVDTIAAELLRQRRTFGRRSRRGRPALEE